jgi:hypothetical protein
MHPVIYEASLPGLIRVLLIVLIVYAVYSIFIRVLLPLMMRKFVNDLQNRFTGDNEYKQTEQNRKKEGEVSIKFVDKDKNTSTHPDEGEYVDYEEIK